MKLPGFLRVVMVFLSGSASVVHADEAKMPMAKNPPQVLIDAARMKSTRTTGGDFDDKTQIVQLEVVAKNGNLNVKSIKDLTLYYWAFAQLVEDRKAYSVIDAGSVPVDLDNTQEGREVRAKGTEVTLKLDNTGIAKFGKLYKGFLLVLTNDKKEIVAVKASLPAWQTNFARAFDLKGGSTCDMTLKPLARK
jgi:hypothetical protein